jgi:hypothetical protein
MNLRRGGGLARYYFSRAAEEIALYTENDVSYFFWGFTEFKELSKVVCGLEMFEKLLNLESLHAVKKDREGRRFLKQQE